ncbi:hypothetical protein M406DRAFT_269000 [Cryphonectria parasitica EP155]|uniref:RGS domain-containing protein n=1 Tax=Cryphonectria parasitica (strain ATCC 38755 / EP155) TaxID=660469 RepID=A0A9P4XSF5_CRYP1|nr:uncharacterized protein M406DRAFT_269000 [Cryphonectria parasitica EP155]KAF3760387.1 hypothetical protein M406DRAFT_269000 [Cryphonectria parasitica EP155]
MTYHQKAYQNVSNATYSSNHSSPGRRHSEDDIRDRQSISSRTVGSSAIASRSNNHNMPDFFSNNIFQIVLHDPATAHRLLKFSETRLCAENVEFLAKVDAYKTTLDDLASQMASIHKTFLSPGSHSQISASGGLLKEAHKEIKSLVNQALPSMETVFTDLQNQVETLVFQDIYPRFVRHQLALSATRALGSDRFKYQGLGDCFCLTNPNMADNPIVFASDGFIKVTGYTRPEIIPRNCRFLQGAQTDRRPVQLLKKAIQERKESVELLLNYKKNGGPFWNLLYVAPLFNARGETEFFLGGQVNCSTTIHNNIDVMKVLSASDTNEAAEDIAVLQTSPPTTRQPMRPSARRALLKALGVRQAEQAPVIAGDAGMENGVLERMQGQGLSSQMKEFYSAYSKYLVVRASNFVIEFYSEGVMEALSPANMAGTMVAGSDVFRFFAQNMISKQSEYKTRVRNSIRGGTPVSTALRLQTKRSAVFRGDEAFMAHWTPLKDDKAA